VTNWATPIHWYQCPGTLFSLNTDGTDFRVEHAFSQLSASVQNPLPSSVKKPPMMRQRRIRLELPVGLNLDGYHPYGSLAMTSDGVLHGVTVSGGANGKGVLFSFDPSTSSFKVDYSFCPSAGCDDGYAPMGSLAALSDGYRVIGTASAGGNKNGDGTVWVWDSRPSRRTFGSVSLNSATTGRTPVGGFANTSLSGGGAFGMTGRGLTSYCKWGKNQGCGAPFYFDPNAMTVTPYPPFPDSAPPSPSCQYGALQTPYVLPEALGHWRVPKKALGHCMSFSWPT
jgi:uncharacterized repeat protein (TIGR03803 family)